VKGLFKSGHILCLGLDDNGPKARYLVDEYSMSSDLLHDRQCSFELIDDIPCLSGLTAKYITNYEHGIPSNYWQNFDSGIETIGEC